jgi:hypothetical protein
LDDEKNEWVIKEGHFYIGSKKGRKNVWNCYDDENELPKRGIKFEYNIVEGWTVTGYSEEKHEGVYVDFKSFQQKCD